MRCGYLPGILAGACLLLSGCPTDPDDPPVGEPIPRDLNEAIKVVGAEWTPLAAKDTGGPTVVPPKVTSNSSKSFDVELAGVDAGHTLYDVAKLYIAIEDFDGHYVFDVEEDDRTPTGSILVTIVQEQADLLPGAFTLQVVATDAADNEVAIAEVSAAFFSATACAGEDGEDGMAGVGETVALAATFEGATGTPDVTWSRVSGPTTIIEDQCAANTTFVPLAVGTYVMKLEAVDPTGVVDLDLASILVVDTFTVDAGESKIVTVGEPVDLYGLAGGGVGQASFAWTEISDHGVTIENADSRVAGFVAYGLGEYEFELTATDEIFGEASDRVIYAAVHGLTAMADAPAQAEPGATIQLQGQAAGGLYPYAFRWTQTGGPEVDIEDSTNQTALVSLSNAGTYTFELRVKDSTASAATDSVTTSVPCVLDSDCDDGDGCTTDTCDVDTGECLREDIICDDDRVCVEGDCVPAPCYADADCIDPFFCNGTEACTIPEGETKGICTAGTNPCEADQICLEDANECRPLGVVFFDDFEAGLGGWSVDNGIWEVGIPSSGPDSAYSPVQLAATVLAGDIPVGTSSGLVSRSIQLPVIGAEEEIHLRFWHWFALGDRCGGWCVVEAHVQIREQTAPGQWETWTTLKSFGRSSGVYSNSLVDLSGYAGKRVQIRFFLYQTTGLATAGWYVDDVTIEVR